MKCGTRRMPDQTGRTAIVTGADTGIGCEAAKALMAAGARVVVAVRNVARGEAAAARIRSANAETDVEARVRRVMGKRAGVSGTCRSGMTGVRYEFTSRVAVHG